MYNITLSIYCSGLKQIHYFIYAVRRISASEESFQFEVGTIAPE